MKVGYFEESEGVKSSMRLNSFIALWASIALSLFALATKQLDVNVLGLITVFLVGAFAPKAVQKFAENTQEK
jgi:hypothetical protein